MNHLFDAFTPVGLAQTARILGGVEAAIKSPASGATQLDSATSGAGQDDGTAMDDASGAYADQYVATMAVAVVNEWASTADALDSGETAADRLVMMLLGIADSDGDGDIGEAENIVAGAAVNAAYAYMVNLGVTEDDAQAIFGDDEASNSAAERVRELVASKLPDGDAAEAALLDAMVFTPADQEPVMDSAYKRVVAIHGGQKVIIQKRISGTPHLSPKQKLALQKARRKAHGAPALARRMKSMRRRRQMGL